MTGTMIGHGFVDEAQPQPSKLDLEANYTVQDKTVVIAKELLS